VHKPCTLDYLQCWAIRFLFLAGRIHIIHCEETSSERIDADVDPPHAFS